MRALDTVAGLDRAWSGTKIQLLIDGMSVDNNDEMLIAETVYEARTRCLDGFEDPAEGVLEHAQMVKAIRTIRDPEVRAAMLLKVYAGSDEFEIELALRSKRAGNHLIERGCELVRRHERGQHAAKRRLQGVRGEGPACWKCMKVVVAEPGDVCGECAVAKLPGRPQGSGVNVEDMGLEDLIRTQDDADDHIPGARMYRERVQAWGDVNQAGGSRFSTWTTPHGIGGGKAKKVLRADE